MKLITAVIKPFKLEEVRDSSSFTLLQPAADKFEFITDGGTQLLESNEGAVLVVANHDGPLPAQAGRPLLIIAEDVEGEAIAAVMADDNAGESLTYFESFPGTAAADLLQL